MFSRKIRIFIGMILIAIITTSITGCTIMPEEEGALAPPLVKPKITEYELYKVAKKDITKELKGTGNLIASTEKTLYFEQSGARLKSIDVELGEKVKKGMLLVRLDSGNLQIQLKLQKNTVEKLQFQINIKKKLYERYMSLPENSRPPKMELEDIMNEKRLQEFDLNSASIVLEDIKNQIAKLNLTSPVNGVVTFIEDLKAGDTVDAYKQIITVSDPSKLQIYYQSDSVKDIKSGMQAAINHAGKEYKGEVVLAQDNAPVDALDKYKDAIILIIKEMSEEMKLGDSVDFIIEIKSKKDVISIPKQGLKVFLSRKYVQILEGGTKKEFDVQTGIETEDQVEIVDGLKEGQMVILN